MSAFPSTPYPSSASIRSVAPTRVSVSHSGKRNTRSRAAQRYALQMAWNNRTRAEMAPVIAFIEQQRGQYGNFTITAPLQTAPLGSWAGTPLVDGAAQTGYTINLKGFTPSAANVAKAGDFVKFAGDAKVYRVAADASADGAGKAAVTLVQALLASPADSAAVTSSSVPFTMACASDLMESSVKTGGFYDFALDMVEDC